MINGNKKDSESGIAKFEAMLKSLNDRCPDLTENLNQYVKESDKIPEHIRPAVEELYKLVLDACAEIRHEHFTEAEFVALFPQNIQDTIQKLTKSRLRAFHALAPLRNLYSESPSRAEYLVDQIWQRYVIRFDPDRKIERPNGITDEDMAELEGALDSFAELCVVRTLHYNGIIEALKEQANMPDELCEYIARIVDKDYQELRLNYLVTSLDSLKEGQK